MSKYGDIYFENSLVSWNYVLSYTKYWSLDSVLMFMKLSGRNGLWTTYMLQLILLLFKHTGSEVFFPLQQRTVYTTVIN